MGEVGGGGTDPAVLSRLSAVEVSDANAQSTLSTMLGTTIPTAQGQISTLQSNLSALTVNNSFVTTGTGMTVADLIATYPPGSTYVGKYARVSDLYGSVDEIMRCRWDGTNYRWVPQRESFAGNNPSTSGTVTLAPLFTPPTVRLTGGLTANISVTPSSINAYIGQRFRVVNNAVLGIFTATITGLVGSNLSVLGSGSRDVEYGPTGWFAAT